MGHNDLGDHYYYLGDVQNAFKCYTNAREYLTIPIHIIEMCRHAVETSMELGKAETVVSYVAKLRQVPTSAEKAEVLTVLPAIQGVMDMEASNFKNAANHFLSIPFDQHGKIWKVGSIFAYF
jgi:COP9 signalosome complex subunit 1